jgi:large subunit ribosomal protein L21
MYAVVTTGGKQYRVEAGSMLVVEKLVGEPGSSVTFDRVLLVGDGEKVTVGTPTVAGATVSATVLGNERGRKIVVFKFKQKVKYRRRTGHRQELTRLRVDAITADGKTVRAEQPAAPAPAATAKSEAPKAEAKASGRARAKADTAAEKASAPKAKASAETAEPAKPARRPRAKTATADAQDAETSAQAAKAEPSVKEKTKAPAKPRASRTPKPASAKEE